MSYFSVLAIFLLLPLVILAIYVPRQAWSWVGACSAARLSPNRRDRPGSVGDPVARLDWKPYLAILVHILLALVYTTPWDNYLVASGIWWYDPQLVTGITLGWVPL
jgi:cobalamin synthase